MIQGNPLSPFLFIIAMDVLNIAMQEAFSSHVYLDVKLPRNGPSASYLLYVDDVMFFFMVNGEV